MASDGEISELQQLIGEGAPHEVALRRLLNIVQMQHARIKALEQEIFDRCFDLRQRVAKLEQPNGR